MASITILPVNEGGFVVQGEGVLTQASGLSDRTIDLDGVERLYEVHAVVMADGFVPTDSGTHTTASGTFRAYLSPHGKSRVVADTALLEPFAAGDISDEFHHRFYSAGRSIVFDTSSIGASNKLWIIVNGK